MGKVRLSAAAEADILDIFVYGYEKFGLGQAVAYQESLAHCFSLLADNSKLGRPAPSIDDKVRRHNHQRHSIFYDLTIDGVLILAIVDQRSTRRPVRR